MKPYRITSLASILLLVLLLLSSVTTTTLASSKGVRPPEPLLDNPHPGWPMKAIVQGAEGAVRYRAEVKPDGTVGDVEILSVTPEGVGFEEAVIDAVKQWRFKPAYHQGKKVTGVYEETEVFSVRPRKTGGRMYPMSSAELWTQVVVFLKEKKFAFDSFDEKNGVIVTRQRKFESRSLGDLKRFETPDGIRVWGFELHLFVSPFAEPARLYVGSMARGGKGHHMYNLYHHKSVMDWFYASIEERIGVEGEPIPFGIRPRQELARRLSGEEKPDRCTFIRMRTPLINSKQNATHPLKIDAAHVLPIFPEKAQERRHVGTVTLSSVIHEDGWIDAIKVRTSETVDPGFEVSARNTVSYWRYRPAMLSECPVSAPFDVSVRYSYE